MQYKPTTADAIIFGLLLAAAIIFDVALLGFAERGDRELLAEWDRVSEGCMIEHARNK